MTRVDEFDHFYSSTAKTTLRSTYAVCGDRNVAFEATVDAYRHAWRDWGKIRDHYPESWVRNEAWRLTGLSRSTHLLRRRTVDEADVKLLDALARMKVDDRRLLALLTLGAVDLEVACREVGVPIQQGAETVTTALVSLEHSVGGTLDQLEERLHRLGTAMNSVVIPAAGVIRHRAQLGRRRNTIALVALTMAIVAGGAFAVLGEPATADRQRIGEERPDMVLQAQKLDASDLLTASDVSALNRSRAWTVLSTNDDSREKTPYATCPPTRFADPDPLRAFVRTFQASKSNDRVAQSVEVAPNSERADAAAKRLERWFSDCRLPRVQLTHSWTVRRPFGDFRILQLVSDEGETQVFTVGIGTSGMIVDTVVHKTDGDEGPDIGTFAKILDTSEAGICRFGGSRCASGLNVVESAPPPAARAPAFLSPADLPPIADVEAVWTAVQRKQSANPAATVCDSANFKESRATTRVYVMPSDSSVPNSFGLTQTIGKFSDDDAAERFVNDIKISVDKCPKKAFADLEDERKIDINGAKGWVWRFSIEVSKKDAVHFRTAVIRRGSVVTQVTLTPEGRFDMSRRDFRQVAERAGQRLQYYPG